MKNIHTKADEGIDGHSDLSFPDSSVSPSFHITRTQPRQKSHSFHTSDIPKDSTTLTGAILTLLNECSPLSVIEITEKLMPIYHMLKGCRVTEKTDIIRRVEGCLNASKNKLFVRKGEGKVWSINDHRAANNYFSLMEKRISKKIEKKPKQKKITLRKHSSKYFEDTIEKLSMVLGYMKKNSKLFPLIKSNPFSKLKNISAKIASNKGELEEQILATIIGSQDIIAGKERLTGILQCFYHFFPLITSQANKQKLLLSRIHQKILRATNKLDQ